MNNVIIVENLGKKYILHHQQREQYTSLRDVITNRAAAFGNKLLRPFKFKSTGSSPLIPSSEHFWALKDVSFEVKQGDRIGIIGRNGAGKSTLLKILSRITEPTTGRVKIKGRIACLLEVGTGFHPELTGRENVFLNGAILGMGRAEIRKKFDEIIDFAEIEKFLDTPVKRYSSGMYVRLAFAVAAHLEPEILVVDEVLAVGDTQFQKKCLGKMEDVSAKEGRTVLFVSHNMQAIRSLCNRVVVIKEGKLLCDALPDIGINLYTEGIKGSVTFREWRDEHSAPNNMTLFLKRVFIATDDACQKQIFTDNYFDVFVDYIVKNPGGYVGLTILVHDMEDKLIFSSINNHESSYYGKPMQPGEYRSMCRIPANLLNDGWIKISLIVFGKNFTDAVTVENVLMLEIIDGPTVRGDFFGVCGGAVRPLLQWNTHSL